EGVVCAEDAELIGATRLGELNLRDAAEVSRVSYAAIKARRARAERALVAWLRGGIVAKAPRIPGSSGAGRPGGGRRRDRPPRLARSAGGPKRSGVLDALRTWLIGILAALATLFLTIGGIRYLTAGGDPVQVEKAKTALKSAAIGYALAALAPVIVSILRSVV